MRIPRALVWVSHGVSAAFLGFGVIFPLLSTFGQPGHSGSFVSLLLDPMILQVTRFTALQAFCSVLISAAIGLPLGLWVRGGRRLEALLALPFGVPTLVVAVAWIGILGKRGLLANLGFQNEWGYSAKAVVLAHVFLNAPWIALRVSQARAEVSSRLLEAAGTLGANRWNRFSSVIWPEVRGPLLSAACQVFSLCAMSFTLVLILGGGPPVETLETSIYSRIRYSGMDIRGALACATWQSLLTVVPWWLVRLLDRAHPREQMGQARVRSPWSVSWTLKLSVVAVFLIPYLYVVLSSVRRISLLDASSWEEIGSAFSISLRLALMVAIACLVFSAFGVLSSSRAGRAKPWFESLWIFPGGLSTLVLSLSIWLTYEKWLDFFSGGLWIMALVQTLIFLPVVFRILSDTAAGVRVRLLEAASTLGASPIRAFGLIEWPRWRTSVLTALGVVFIASLGEVAAVSLFANGSHEPLPFMMTRWMHQYRFNEAEMVGAFLVVSASLLMLSLTWIRTRERWAR